MSKFRLVVMKASRRSPFFADVISNPVRARKQAALERGHGGESQRSDILRVPSRGRRRVFKTLLP